MCGRGTSAILRVWKLKPWLPEGWWVDVNTLTVNASVCSSGSISTSSGGCSTVTSSRGCGWNQCWGKTVLWQQHVPNALSCCDVTLLSAHLPFPPFHIPLRRWDWQSRPCVESWFLSGRLEAYPQGRSWTRAHSLRSTNKETACVFAEEAERNLVGGSSC